MERTEPRSYIQTPLGEEMAGKVAAAAELLGLSAPQLLFHAVAYNIPRAASDLAAGHMAGVIDYMNGPSGSRIRSLMNDLRRTRLEALGALSFPRDVTYPRGRLIAASVRRWMSDTAGGTKTPAKPPVTHAAAMLLAVLLTAKQRRERPVWKYEDLLPVHERLVDATVAPNRRRTVTLMEAATNLDAAGLVLLNPVRETILLRAVVY